MRVKPRSTKKIQERLTSPVLVFDSGVGSYDIASRIHEAFPKQDIVYLADHAAFPYGKKSHDELLQAVSDAVRFGKERYGVNTVVLASMTPSLMILEELRERYPEMTIHGAYPPVEKALQESKTGKIAVLCTESMAKSKELQQYLQNIAPEQVHDITIVNASGLINDLVETGAFLSDKEGTAKKVKTFIDEVREQNPSIDSIAFSSTHLPWLNRADTGEYFKEACPNCAFVDASSDLVESLHDKLPNRGKGILKAICTPNPKLPVDIPVLFKKMGIKIDIEEVEFRGKKGSPLLR